jgi:hypothetical protein
LKFTVSQLLCRVKKKVILFTDTRFAFDYTI